MEAQYEEYLKRIQREKNQLLLNQQLHKLKYLKVTLKLGNFKDAKKFFQVNIKFFQEQKNFLKISELCFELIDNYIEQKKFQFALQYAKFLQSFQNDILTTLQQLELQYILFQIYACLNQNNRLKFYIQKVSSLLEYSSRTEFSQQNEIKLYYTIMLYFMTLKENILREKYDKFLKNLDKFSNLFVMYAQQNLKYLEISQRKIIEVWFFFVVICQYIIYKDKKKHKTASMTLLKHLKLYQNSFERLSLNKNNLNNAMKEIQNFQILKIFQQEENSIKKHIFMLFRLDLNTLKKEHQTAVKEQVYFMKNFIIYHEKKKIQLCFRGYIYLQKLIIKGTYLFRKYKKLTIFLFNSLANQVKNLKDNQKIDNFFYNLFVSIQPYVYIKNNKIKCQQFFKNTLIKTLLDNQQINWDQFNRQFLIDQYNIRQKRRQKKIQNILQNYFDLIYQIQIEKSQNVFDQYSVFCNKKQTNRVLIFYYQEKTNIQKIYSLKSLEKLDQFFILPNKFCKDTLGFKFLKAKNFKRFSYYFYKYDHNQNYNKLVISQKCVQQMRDKKYNQIQQKQLQKNKILILKSHQHISFVLIQLKCNQYNTILYSQEFYLKKNDLELLLRKIDIKYFIRKENQYYFCTNDLQMYIYDYTKRLKKVMNWFITRFFIKRIVYSFHNNTYFVQIGKLNDRLYFYKKYNKNTNEFKSIYINRERIQSLIQIDKNKKIYRSSSYQVQNKSNKTIIFNCLENKQTKNKFQIPVSYILLKYFNKKILNFCKNLVKKNQHQQNLKKYPFLRVITRTRKQRKKQNKQRSSSPKFFCSFVQSKKRKKSITLTFRKRTSQNLLIRTFAIL